MPVLYAVGEMSQTMRARGEEVTVEVWGPGEGGGWQSAAAEASLAPAARLLFRRFLMSLPPPRSGRRTSSQSACATVGIRS